MKFSLGIIFLALILCGTASAQDSLNIVKLCTLPMTAYQVEVQGDYAYVAAGEDGLLVIDVRDPVHPREVGRCRLSCSAQAIILGDECAYVWGGEDHGAFRISFIDLTIPEDPMESGYFEHQGFSEYGFTKMALYGSLLYTLSGEIVDFSNPGSPQVVGECPTGRKFTIEEDHFFYTIDDCLLGICDLSNPTEPAEIARLELLELTPVNVSVSDTILIVTGIAGFASVYNISNPAEPSELAFIDLGLPIESVVAAPFFNGEYYIDPVLLSISDFHDPVNPRVNVGWYHPPFCNNVSLGVSGLIYTSNRIGFQIFRFTPPEDAAPQPNTTIPTEFALYAAYPNPFNSSTRLEYSMAVAGRVSLKLYDLTGREVVDLVDKVDSPGRHSVTLDGAGLAAGIYFATLTGEGFVEKQKIALVK